MSRKITRTLKTVFYVSTLTLTALTTHPVVAEPIDTEHAHGTILPGVTIIQYEAHSKWYCTLGLIVVDKATRTHKYGITAGHCYHPGEIYALDDSYDEPQHERPIGTWVSHQAPPENDTLGLGYDLGLFQFYNTAPVNSTIYDGTVKFVSILTKPYSVTQLNPADRVCKFGSTTALTCGTLTQRNSKDKYSDQKIIVPSRGFSSQGDSGAAVWANDPQYGTVLLGIVNSARRDGSSTTVQYVADFLHDQNLELL